MNVQEVLEKLERLRLTKEVYAELIQYVNTGMKPDDLGSPSASGLDRDKAFNTGVLDEVLSGLKEQVRQADDEITRIMGVKVNVKKK